MQKQHSLLIFSAALVTSAVIVGGSILYTSQKNAPAAYGGDGHMTLTDEAGQEYVVEKEDPIKLTIVSDQNCETCDTQRLEMWLRGQVGLPFAVRRLDISDPDSSKLLASNRAAFLPYLLVDKAIESHPNFAHLTHHVLSQAPGGYFVDLRKVGAPIGRYLDATYYTKGDPAAPKAVTELRDHDFGDVRLSDGKVQKEFTIRNDGKSPLEFLNANTSCGCTSAQIVLPDEESPVYMMAGHQEPVKWHGSLAPGEEGKIVVYYDPSVHPDLNGAVTRTVTVDTNDPETPQLTFKIEVNQIAN